MTTSGTAVVIMCVVIVAALAIWLGSVALAARKPYHEHPDVPRRRARVLGGTHVGQGRSVAPRRDEPVNTGQQQVNTGQQQDPPSEPRV